MQIPEMFYGRPGVVRKRARGAVKGLAETLNFDAVDPGPLIDTSTRSGILVLSSGRHQEPGDQFHCYALSAALSEQADDARLLEVMKQWMLWSFGALWRFIGVLGEDTTFVLGRCPELRRPYVTVAAKYWELLNAEGRRYGPFIDQPGLVSDHWRNLSYSVANLGIPNDQVGPALEAGPSEFLRRIREN